MCMYVMSFSPHDKHVVVPLLSPNYRWENRRRQSKSPFQLVNSRSGIPVQASGFRASSCLCCVRGLLFAQMRQHCLNRNECSSQECRRGDVWMCKDWCHLLEKWCGNTCGESIEGMLSLWLSVFISRNTAKGNDQKCSLRCTTGNDLLLLLLLSRFSRVRLCATP